ncbi:alkaline phosphatase family protein [Tunturiibacter psychrotolerans]|uniref:alkaline phosphatase family protein n=1 Tax=Tunturiibacter psychrotolerans TaxID=3069686 RepID=UPI003D19EAD0
MILPGIDPTNHHALARCGHRPRLPLLVLSPWSKENFVDHTLTDQTSVILLKCYSTETAGTIPLPRSPVTGVWKSGN